MAEHVIMVERETYKKGEKEFYTYFIKGNIRGVAFRLAVVPPDIGGYTVLDIVFGKEMKAELTVKPFEIKGEDGSVIKGNTYGVKSVDEDGKVYECSIKPSRQSDKALLSMLLN